MAKPIPAGFKPEWWEWDEKEEYLRHTPAGKAVSDWINSQPHKVIKKYGDVVVVEVMPN